MDYEFDIDALDALYNSVNSQTGKWAEELEALKNNIQTIVDTSNMAGKAADNIKSYFEYVHITIIGLLSQLACVHSSNCFLYKTDYQKNIDKNIHAIIKSSELREYISDYNINKNSAINIDEGLAYVLSGIKDIFNVSYQKIYYVDSSHKALTDFIEDLDNKIQSLENNHFSNDFTNSTDMINSLKAFINENISFDRSYKTDFAPEKLSSSKAFMDAYYTCISINKELEAKEKLLNEAIENEKQRVADLQAEREKKAGIIKWIAVGVAIVGSVVLVAVTAGGATPLACAAVGATFGGVSAATNEVADNYEKNGAYFEGMDWKKFGKNVVIGTVGGAASGYLGAVSMGSAIAKPIEKATIEFAKTTFIEAAEGLSGMAWEVGEGLWDVGVAVISGKPGDEILSVLSEEKDELISDLTKDVKDTLKDVTVNGAKNFAAGFVAGNFSVDTSEKGALRKIGEKTLENVSGDISKGIVNASWGVGEAVFDNDSSTTVESVLKGQLKETGKDIAGSIMSAGVSEGLSPLSDKIDGKFGKVMFETVKDTAGNTAEKIAGGVFGRTVDFVVGDEEDASKIFGDIWKEDLDSGRSIVQDAGISLGKNATDEITKDRKFYNELNKIDRNHDGKIDVVQFDDYAVTKEDYDAAVANAGKGVYKDKTVQDILGLPKDTDLSLRKERTIKIDMTEKYSSSRKTTDTVTIDGKYTFSRSYYDSAVKVAGTGEYADKTAQDILGIPKDTDLSDKNLTYRNRIDNDDIGKGKDVEFHRNDGTNATKIHISSMKHETKVAREKAKKA